MYRQPSEMQAPSAGIARSLTLAALGGIVLRHWLLVVIVAVITAIICRQVLSSRDPMYRAQASVYFTPGGDPGDTRGPDIGYLNTQRDQMLSMPRLEQAVRIFDLEEEKPYRSVADPPALLAQRLSAQTDKDTWVVKLELVDEFPERGRRLLDHLITGYAGSLEDRNRSRRDRERVYWQDRAQHLRGELRHRRQEINSFKREARIISTDPAANRFTRLLYTSRVQWQTLGDEIAERRGLFEQIDSLDTDALTAGGRDVAAWTELIGHLSQLGQENGMERAWQTWLESHQLLAERSLAYGERHPVLRVARQLEEERFVQMRAVAGAVRGRAERRQEAGQRRHADLGERIAGQEESLATYQRQLVELALQQREHDAGRRALEQLDQRVAELEVADQMREPGMQVISPTHVGSKPYNVQPRVLLVVSVFAGLVAGGMSAVLLEMNNRYVRGAELAQDGSLPVLAGVPFVRELRGGLDRDKLLASPELREPFRTLAAAVTMQAPAVEGRALVLAITSPVQEDGKSMCASMLAITLALAGKRVLLVDSDLRRSQLHTIFGVDHRESGLAQLLGGAEELSPILTGIERLELLPSGPLPPNPISLIHGAGLENAIASCAAAYDVVIIDTPPVGLVSDAAVIARTVDRILLVVRDRRTPRSMLRAARSGLSSVDDKVFGCVVNASRGHLTGAIRPYGEEGSA